MKSYLSAAAIALLGSGVEAGQSNYHRDNLQQNLIRQYQPYGPQVQDGVNSLIDLYMKKDANILKGQITGQLGGSTTPQQQAQPALRSQVNKYVDDIVNPVYFVNVQKSKSGVADTIDRLKSEEILKSASQILSGDLYVGNVLHDKGLPPVDVDQVMKQYLARDSDTLAKQITEQLNSPDYIIVQARNGVPDTLDKIMQEQILRQTSIIASGDDDYIYVQKSKNGVPGTLDKIMQEQILKQTSIIASGDDDYILVQKSKNGVPGTLDKIMQEQILKQTSIIASGDDDYIYVQKSKNGVPGTLDKIMQEQILKQTSIIASGDDDEIIFVQERPTQVIGRIKDEEIYKNMAGMLGGSGTAKSIGKIEQLELLHGTATAGQRLNVQNPYQGRDYYPSYYPQDVRYSRRY